MPHACVSHIRLYHSDANAGSVLTPHDYITNVQKRLGKRTWTGCGHCQLYGSFVDSQLEHGETCCTGQATRGHYACFHAVLEGQKLAYPGKTTKPRGLTEAQSRLADLFRNRCCPGTQLGSGCVWHPPTHQQLEETLRRQPFDRKISHYTSEIPDLRAQGIVYRPLDSGRSTTPSSHLDPTIRSRHCSVPQGSAKVSQITPAQMEARI